MTMRHQKATKGFTLLELMIVIAVIGILSAIAIPRFSDAIKTSNEGGTKAALGAVRSGLSIYYSDMDGQYPASMDPLTTPGNKYFKAPGNTIWIYTQPHGKKSDTDYVSAYTGDTGDTGNLGYVDSGSEKGKVFVRCTHTDSKGSVWTNY